jgi:hypothetical protein
MRRVVIFFPSEWVAYSPTILNLVEVLRLSIPVRVIAIDNGKYDNTRLDPGVFHLIKVPDWLFRGTAVVWAYRRLKYWLLTKSITPEVSDIVIGVDNLGVLCAQAVYNYVHFLSLEIERDRLFQCIDWTRVLSLAIQSEVRLRYLFPKDAPAPVFLLPNAPILRSPPAAEAASHGRQLILLGNLTPAHGVFQCIDAVAGMEAATLTLKGPMRVSMRRAIESRYPKLLNDKRLIMDTTYVPQEDMVEYLKQFDVGFCFYDFNILKKGISITFLRHPESCITTLLPVFLLLAATSQV